MTFRFTSDERLLIAQLRLMYALTLPSDYDLGYEEAEKLRDAALDFEVTHGLDSNYLPTADGLLAISIADKLLAA